jgi:exonuclease SbcC
MRPLKLTFQAFISYKDKVTIDFSSFDNDLFLISGDTGSGKTTIFEAICFALYGQPSGEYRNSDDLRCNFSNPDEETFVDFTFEVNDVIYNIVRTPKQDVSKKRGEGLITRYSSAVLTYSGKPPISKFNEVGKKIEEIIGLNRNQFKQTMMIAQNDFMNLINAKTEERKEIYEKIFNTFAYKDFTENLKSMQKDANDKLTSSDGSIKTHLTTINSDIEELRAEIKGALSGFLLDGKLDLLIERIEQFQDKKHAEIESKKKEKMILEQTIETKQGTISKIDTTNANIDKYFNSKRTFDDLESRTKEDYLPRKNQIERIEQAKEVRSFENAYNTSLSSKQNAVNKDALWNKEKIKLEGKLETAIENSKKAETKKPEIEKLNSEKTSISNILGKYNLLSLKITDKSTAQDELNETERKWKTVLFDIQTRSDKYEANAEIVNGIKITESDIARTESKQNELNTLIGNLDNIDGFFNKIENNQKELKTLKNNLKDRLTEFKKLGEEKNKVTVAYYANMAGVLASELEENKPCPVCGSLTHPEIASGSDEVVDKETFNRAVETYNDKQKAVNTIASSIEIKDKLIESDIANITRSNKGYFEFDSNDISSSKTNFNNKEKLVKDELDQLELDLVSDRKSLKEKNSLIETQKTLEEAIENLKSKKTELTIQMNTETDKLSSILESIEDLKKELPYETKDKADYRITEITSSINKYQDDIDLTSDTLTKVKSDIESNNTLLLNNSKNLETIEVELKEKKEEFEKQIFERKFKSVEDYQEALSFEKELQTLRKYIFDFDSALNIAKGNLEAYKEYKDKTKVDTFVQIREVNELKDNKKAFENDISDLEANYKQNETSLASIARIRKDRVKQEEEANRLSLLYKTASGNLSQKAKIDFETYIQTAYFNQILNKANVRFERMCNNRYQLVKVEQEKISADYALDIFVYDNYTGMTRNASTLSGGESFMATLALALGLSDVILESNGGIRLDSMFIDEGFGSLDDESLSSALEVLSNLSNGSRMVGIISHVDELKNKINKQIEITKGNDGSYLKIKV